MFEASLKERGGEGLLKEGEIVKGTVVQVTKDYAVVDIGYKSEGQIPISEFTNATGEVTRQGRRPRRGAPREPRERHRHGRPLQREGRQDAHLGRDLAPPASATRSSRAPSSAASRAACSVDIGVKAFLPGSQVDIRPVRNLDQYIWARSSSSRSSSSTRSAATSCSPAACCSRSSARSMKKETLKNLKEGAVLKGVVKNLTDYGAFIDLGGIDGLLHITDMSLGPHRPPERDVQRGRRGPRRGPQVRPRAGARLARPQADPGRPVAPRRREVPGRHARQGQGRVSSPTTARSSRSSRASKAWCTSPRCPGPSGSSTRRRCSRSARRSRRWCSTSIPKAKRIALGMKQIEQNPWTLLEDKYPIGSVIKGQVRNVTDFGIFVGVEEGVDGLVHVSDISLDPARSSTRASSTRRATKSRRWCSTSTSRTSASRLGIKQLQPGPLGDALRAHSRWAAASRARSPRSPTSAPSWRSSRASRAWCTSPS